MAIIGIDGNEMVNVVPPIVDVRPTGNQIVFEKLTPQEIMGTSLHIQDDVKAGPTQAYIVAIGALCDPKWGIKVGDRVIVSGNFLPLPIPSKAGRDMGIIDPSCIKVVLIEKQ